MSDDKPVAVNMEDDEARDLSTSDNKPDNPQGADRRQTGAEQGVSVPEGGNDAGADAGTGSGAGSPAQEGADPGGASYGGGTGN